MARRIVQLLALALAGCGDGAGDGESSAAAPRCPDFACPHGDELVCGDEYQGMTTCRCTDASTVRDRQGRTVNEVYQKPYDNWHCFPNGFAVLHGVWDGEQVAEKYWDADGYPTDQATAFSDSCQAWKAEGLGLTCD